MNEPTSLQAVLRGLDEHPRVDDLARLVCTVALGAADEQRVRLDDGLEELMTEAGLGMDDGETPFGNALSALQQPEGPPGPARLLLCCLAARGISLSPPQSPERIRLLATQLSWLAAHTTLVPTVAVDEVLGPRADPLWPALADVVRRAERAEPDRPSRCEALGALAALAAGHSRAARQARAELLDELTDASLRAVLDPARSPTSAATDRDGAASSGPVAGGDEPLEKSLEGELVPAPMRAVWLVLWAVTGLLLLRYLLRLVARLILRWRRPAKLRVGPTGITLASSVTVLGRTVRSAETHIPVDNLARAIKDVRYPRLALYTALVALAVGTFLGVSLAADGLRAGSPALIGLGAAVFGLGVLCDLVFSVLVPAGRKRCRLIVQPYRGATVALLTADADGASAALRRLDRLAR